MTILDIKKQYFKKIDPLDLDLLISYTIKKDREFVLAHPEQSLSKKQELKIKSYIQRRLKNEPLAYILEKKEFYGLNFKVSKNTLIPRPETELLVDMALEFMKTNGHENIKTSKQTNTGIISSHSPIINIIDVGTGSGNIIISLTHQLKNTSCQLLVTSYYGIDISKDALKIAKQNARLQNVHKEIKFLHGNLLEPLLKSKIINYKSSLLVLANLPYLSRDIYNACANNVKKYEPKNALYSADHGLAHYNKLLSQIKLLTTNYKIKTTILIEISPEQKKLLPFIIKKYFPQSKIEFKKDLSQKWRVCKLII